MTLPFFPATLIEDLASNDGHRTFPVKNQLRSLGYPNSLYTPERLWQDLQEHAMVCVRERAVQILGGIFHERAIATLLQVSTDENLTLIHAAKNALENHDVYISDHVITPEKIPMIEPSHIDFLGQSFSYEQIKELFLSDEEGESELVYKIITEPSATPVAIIDLVISEGLQHQNAKIRELSAHKSGSRPSFPLLLLYPLLDDSELAVRHASARSIIHLGGRISEPICERLMTMVTRKSEIIKILGRQGYPPAITAICQELQHSHEWERENVVSWMRSGYHADETARNICHHLPRDLIFHLLQDDWWPVSYPLAECIAPHIDETWLPELVTLLAHENPTARLAALHVFATAPIKLPVSLVVALMDDPEESVCWEAIDVLDRYPDDIPTERFLPYLETNDYHVAAVLARRGFAEGIPILLHLAAHDDWNAAYQISLISSSVPIPPQLLLLAVPDSECVRRILEGLSRDPTNLSPYLDEMIGTALGLQLSSFLAPLYHLILAQILRHIVDTSPLFITYLKEHLNDPWNLTQFAVLWALSEVPWDEALFHQIENLQKTSQCPEIVKAATDVIEKQRQKNGLDFRNS